MRDSMTERLLSLFAPADHAEAMAGDLIEEREQRGSAWFWLHVARTMLALWLSAVADRPLKVVMLAVTGAVLFLGPAFVGVAAVGLFPQMLGSPASWLIVSFFWLGGALWVGASLVNMKPRHGMAACALLAVATEILLVVFYTAGVLLPVALFSGGVIARRRSLA